MSESFSMQRSQGEKNTRGDIQVFWEKQEGASPLSKVLLSDTIPICGSSALLMLLMQPSKPSGVTGERRCDHTWNA
jgi:hypothetical protein